jgi:hypothetical protein
MTVLSSINGRVKPGRTEDHLALSTEAVKLMSLLGAEHPRLAFSVADGTAPGGFTFSTEHQNAEAWGEFSDRMSADIEFQGFVNRATGDNAPTTIEMTTVSYEVPLRKNNPQRGNVIEVHVTRPVPGRYEKGLEQAAEVLELVEKRGATNARMFQLGYAGTGSGLTLLSWEFENLRAAGRLADMWTTDKELAEIAMKARFAKDASGIPVWDGLQQVVPL